MLQLSDNKKVIISDKKELNQLVKDYLTTYNITDYSIRFTRNFRIIASVRNIKRIFSISLSYLGNNKEFFTQVILHEIAHIIVFKRNYYKDSFYINRRISNYKAHGVEFKAVCKEINCYLDSMQADNTIVYKSPVMRFKAICACGIKFFKNKPPKYPCYCKQCYRRTKELKPLTWNINNDNDSN